MTTTQRQPAPPTDTAQATDALAAAGRPSQPTQPEPGPRQSLSRRLLASLALCCLTALACWLQWRGLRSEESTYAARCQALGQMEIDAERIRALRQTPQRAADRERPNEELLAQVEAALQQAGVSAELWQDSVPQTPQRLPQSPYQRFTTRLYFEDVSLEQLLRLAHALLAADPSLGISGLHLSAPARAGSATWSADLAVSYLVYAPSAST